MDPRSPTSFFDHLLHEGCDAAGNSARLSRGRFLEDLARDVEDLLNTSSTPTQAPAWAAGCRRSILAYGLPDRAFFGADPAEAARLATEAVARYEPRLSQVRVESIGPDPDRPDSLVLELWARLATAPRTEVVITARLGLGRPGAAPSYFASARDER